LFFYYNLELEEQKQRFFFFLIQDYHLSHSLTKNSCRTQQCWTQKFYGTDVQNPTSVSIIFHQRVIHVGQNKPRVRITTAVTRASISVIKYISISAAPNIAPLFEKNNAAAGRFPRARNKINVSGIRVKEGKRNREEGKGRGFLSPIFRTLTGAIAVRAW
jgi:hypothetical protein